MLLLLSLLVPSAHAGCSKDTDCKGDRICDDGSCADPGLPPVTAKPSTTKPAGPAKAAAPASPDIVWLSKGRVRIGDEVTSLDEARDLLTRDSDAARLLAQSDRQRRTGNAFLWGGLGVAAVGTIVSFTQDCIYIPDIGSVCDSRAPYGVPIAVVGLGVGLGVGLPQRAASVRNEGRAVRAYTQHVRLDVGDDRVVGTVSGRF